MKLKETVWSLSSNRLDDHVWFAFSPGHALKNTGGQISSHLRTLMYGKYWSDLVQARHHGMPASSFGRESPMSDVHQALLDNPWYLVKSAVPCQHDEFCKYGVYVILGCRGVMDCWISSVHYVQLSQPFMDHCQSLCLLWGLELVVWSCCMTLCFWHKAQCNTGHPSIRGIDRPRTALCRTWSYHGRAEEHCCTTWWLLDLWVGGISRKFILNYFKVFKKHYVREAQSIIVYRSLYCCMDAHKAHKVQAVCR